MHKHLLQCHSFLWVYHEHPCEEVPEAAFILLIFQLVVFLVVKYIVLVLTFCFYLFLNIQCFIKGISTFEGVLAKYTVVKDDTNRPYISLMVIGLMLDDFRSHKIYGPTACFRRILDNLSQSKIADFAGIGSIFVLLQEDIFAFEIPMYNISLMYGLNTNHYLMENSKGFVEAKYSLRQFSLILEKIPQITVLHNDKVVTTI